jgi:hypothetical protein
MANTALEDPARADILVFALAIGAGMCFDLPVSDWVNVVVQRRRKAEGANGNGNDPDC